MPKDELPPEEQKPGSEFRLDDLKAGEKDPRGRLVLDILWSVKEFRIYKTEQGINPFFSDNDETAAKQKESYLALGEDIATFNHLLQKLPPQLFLRYFKPADSTTATRAQFERELARCMATAFLDKAETAKTGLASVMKRLERIIINRARVIHLVVNIALVMLVWLVMFNESEWLQYLSGLIFWSLGKIFSFDQTAIPLTLAMGSLGALFSTAISLKDMDIDPAVSIRMHWVYSSIRVLVGALGAFFLYLGFQSGILSGLFRTQPALFTPPPEGAGTVLIKSASEYFYWLCFVSIIAGFSERLVPNLLKARAEQAQGTSGTPSAKK